MDIAKHDLVWYMQTMARDLAEEYERIRSRVREDPGTAGDQGEENWAELLRSWLPQQFHVRTKGRIIGVDGATSPQVDILVLTPAYPPFLLTKKHYLAAGVMAAFECKLTLQAEHVTTAIKQAIEINRLFPLRRGTLYRELNSGFIYGLLAHSHEWKKEHSDPIRNVQKALVEANVKNVKHPSEMLDLLCVADLCNFTATKRWASYMGGVPEDRPILTGYYQHTPAYFSAMYEKTGETFTGNSAPHIAVLLTSLLTRLAWEHPFLRDMADYFHGAGAGGDTVPGTPMHLEGNRMWPERGERVVQPNTMAQAREKAAGRPSGWWDEWLGVF